MSGNKMHIFVLNSIGSFLLFLGKLSITAVACTVAVLWLRVSYLIIVHTFLHLTLNLMFIIKSEL